MEKEDLPTNSVLAVKLDYISKDISAIKNDVADIKKDNITRREFETHVKDTDDKLTNKLLLVDQKIAEVAKDSDWNTKILYGVLTLVIGSIITAVMKLIIK